SSCSYPIQFHHTRLIDTSKLQMQLRAPTKKKGPKNGQTTKTQILRPLKDLGKLLAPPLVVHRDYYRR
ncbi:hypothetical protein BYT27DRAFT_7195834, partial [Phlegmacium glaucopus]